jgi:hypothetical protein
VSFGQQQTGLPKYLAGQESSRIDERRLASSRGLADINKIASAST